MSQPAKANKEPKEPAVEEKVIPQDAVTQEKVEVPVLETSFATIPVADLPEELGAPKKGKIPPPPPQTLEQGEKTPEYRAWKEKYYPQAFKP